MRVATFFLAMAMSSAMALAQNSITTGSVNANAQPVAEITVTCATGDGNTSLKDAVIKELATNGVGVAEQPARAYRVEGVVALGPAKDGMQPIHIDWTVRNPSGERIGRVSQRNEVPAGSLDNAWGMTANQAAGAAALGIVRLLQPEH